MVKEVSGKTAARWIDESVILEAKALLKYSGMSIQEIAYHLNFSTQSFFGKYFKQHTGTSPSRYKRKVIVFDFTGLSPVLALAPVRNRKTRFGMYPSGSNWRQDKIRSSKIKKPNLLVFSGGGSRVSAMTRRYFQRFDHAADHRRDGVLLLRGEEIAVDLERGVRRHGARHGGLGHRVHGDAPSGGDACEFRTSSLRRSWADDRFARLPEGFQHAPSGPCFFRARRGLPARRPARRRRRRTPERRTPLRDP